MNLSRRRLLFAAPAIIAVGSLMKLSIVPQFLELQAQIMPMDQAGSIQIGRNLFALNATGDWAKVGTVSDVLTSGSWQEKAATSIAGYVRNGISGTPMEKRVTREYLSDYRSKIIHERRFSFENAWLAERGYNRVSAFDCSIATARPDLWDQMRAASQFHEDAML